MLYNTQCVNVPIGASGSSHTKARLELPEGKSIQPSGGEKFNPIQVKRAGMGSPSWKAVEVSFIVFIAPSLKQDNDQRQA
jgi:hypothetical protein